MGSEMCIRDRSYAIQWFCFTAIAVIGLFVLIRGDVKDRRKRQAKAARAAQRPVSGDRSNRHSDVPPDHGTRTPGDHT